MAADLEGDGVWVVVTRLHLPIKGRGKVAFLPLFFGEYAAAAFRDEHGGSGERLKPVQVRTLAELEAVLGLIGERLGLSELAINPGRRTGGVTTCTFGDFLARLREGLG